MTDRPVSGAMFGSGRWLSVVAVAVAIGLVAPLAGGGSTADASKAGDRASDLKLKDRAGKQVSLRDLRGKVVVLDFWASWCGPCKKELPALDRLAREYAETGAGVVIVAVNIDKDRAKADRFLKTAGIGAITLLFDPAGTSAGLYDLPTMPTSFVIDGKGVIRHVHAGYKPGDERGLRKQIDALLAPAR